MANFDIASAVTNVKTMLAGLPAWQALCKVATAAEAAEKIYIGVIEDDGAESKCPLISLDINPVVTTWDGGRLRGKIAVEIRMELAIPSSNSRTMQDCYLYMWQQCGNMIAGINGAVGGSGQLMTESCAMRSTPGPIDPNENFGRNEWAVIWDLTMDFI